MGAISGEESVSWEKMQGLSSDGEEKILVLVRLRPLSDKEILNNEVSEWECINETTILFRNSLRERSNYPTAYTFDRVFRGDCLTRQVYDEGTKEIALSAVGGINSTIFAYGQTSSGKTYTMNGITEYTVADIYDYMQRHEERAFVLKFSAMEIYNEVVRDLLSTDNTPLRLLDDPERGTIIEKLTEETLRDWSHLKELLSICETQRQIGETLLNEKSSRSHQILRLTIESSAREFLGKDNSTTLVASVNFVDLAGSERASQALSVGQRLKEGCHINRSLLTLGTVIRKLSKGRQGHINYRDSKLTRILQPALGGNARTAIVCTLSPACSHVEQSRNTLLFASCAKEVTTNAQVNVVMSDKALVKHLQKELARLESELRTPGPACDYVTSLKKKDQQIQKLEKEVRELTKQRDLAQSRVEDLLHSIGNSQTLKERDGFHEEKNTREDGYSVSELSGGTGCNCKAMGIRKSNDIKYSDRGSGVSGVSCNNLAYNDDGFSASEGSYSSWANRDKFVESDTTGEKDEFSGENSDNVCKDVRCIEMDEFRKEQSSELLGLSNGENVGRTSAATVGPDAREVADQESLSTNPVGKIVHIQGSFSYGTLEQNFQDVREKINSIPNPCGEEQFPWALKADMPSSRSLRLTRSRSCRANLMTGLFSPDFEVEDMSEKTPADEFEKDFHGRLRKLWKIPPLNYGPNIARLSRNDSQSSFGSSFIDGGKTPNNLSVDEAIPSVDTFVAGLKEMAKIQYQNQLADGQVDEAEKNFKDVGLDPMQDSLDAPADWPLEFARQQRLILELWQTCHVSLVHRTYFFLLFKGDPMDSIYMEVELRRLSFMKETFSNGDLTVKDCRKLSLSSSMKALQRERLMLSKLVNKRFSEEERNGIYQKWGISLNLKRRRLQLIQLLWRDTNDMSQIKESAAIVAKLIRFIEQGRALKEMYGLSFTSPRPTRRSFGWIYSKASTW